MRSYERKSSIHFLKVYFLIENLECVSNLKDFELFVLYYLTLKFTKYIYIYIKIPLRLEIYFEIRYFDILEFFQISTLTLPYL